MSSEWKRAVSRVSAALTPSTQRISLAEARAATLIRELDKGDNHFRVLETVPHGSLARGTAIAGFDDIDLLLVLSPSTLRTKAGTQRKPNTTIASLARWLEARRKGHVIQGVVRVRKQNHSVGVIYPNRNLRVDLVPALRARGGRYRIPARSDDEWILTRPRATQEAFERVLRRQPAARAAIRLIKGWKRARGKSKGFSLPSYAIEVYCSSEIESGTWRSASQLARHFFEDLASRPANRRLVLGNRDDGHSVVLMDPWSGENLLAKNDHVSRKRLILAARKALHEMDAARTSASSGRAEAATNRLARLFVGNKYMKSSRRR